MAPVEVALQLLGTFVVTTVFFTVTVHLAATYALEEASLFEAVLVGPVPAVISVVVGFPIQQTAPAFTPLAILVVIPADYLAIAWSYELERRMAALVTLGHFVVSILLAASLLGLLGGL